MESLKFKNFEILDHKADGSGNLVITGYGAVFGNVDSYGDVIEKGAFSDTLIDRKDRIAFCYQHDIWNPIGKIIDIYEDEKGLFLKVMISSAEEDIQTKIKEDILKEMSIGYRTMQEAKEQRGEIEVNVLKTIKLFEVSIVTVAANPLAVIDSMKSDEEKQGYIKKEFERIISIVRNEKITFELEKLKSLIFSAPAEIISEPPKNETKETYTKNDYLKLLKNG